MDFKVLRDAITGVDSVDPYNFISFRIIHRMGNILQGKEEVDSEFAYENEEEIVDNLYNHFKSE